MMNYKVEKRVLENQSSEKVIEEFETIESGEIKSYTWERDGYQPKVKFRLFYTDTHIHVWFRVFEEKIDPTYSVDQSPVYKDSCVEFFVGLGNEPKSEYLNFEMNATGTLLLGFGTNFSEREAVVFDRGSLMIATESSAIGCDKPYWQVTYAIPVSLLRKLDNKFELESGLKLKGNFYKCGDDTKEPHYGSGMPISYHKPKFHLPEFFGEIILVEK